MEVEVEHHLVNTFADDMMKEGNIFPKVRWCNPGNSQEKHAEHFNKALKYEYEKKEQVGIGRPFLKLEANRPKVDKQWDEDGMKVKEKTYSYEELLADALSAQDKYNNDLHPDQKKFKGMTRLDVLLYNVNPDLPYYKDNSVARYIGDYTATSIVRSQYVKVQYEKYQLPHPRELGKLSSNNYSVTAYYLPSDDIQEVHLYQHDKFICTCKKIKTFNTARAEWTDEDQQAYQEFSEYGASFRKMVKEGKADIMKVNLLKHTQELEELEVEIIDEPIIEKTYTDYDDNESEDYSHTL